MDRPCSRGDGANKENDLRLVTRHGAPAVPSVRAGWIASACVAGAALLWAAHLVTGYTSLGHDQAWYLYVGKLMLHGAVPYGPMIEDTNPPLILGIALIPVLLAKLLALSAALSFFLFVVGLAVASAGCCYRLLGSAAVPLPRLQRTVLTAAILFAELNVQRATDLGQREQFMVILVMPYLVAFGMTRAREISRGVAIALGVLAALGFCTKPQQILVFVPVQITLYALHRGERRIGSRSSLGAAAVLATCAFYATVTILFLPLYTQHMLPIVRDVYWAFGQMPARTILLQRKFAGLVVLACLLLWWQRRRLSTMPALLLAACVAAHIAYAVQRTGWYYQQIPRNAFLVLFGLWVAIELTAQIGREGRRGLRWTAIAAGFAAFVVLYLSITKVDGIFTPEPTISDSDNEAGKFLASLPEGTPVYVFSTALMPAFPVVVDHDLVWASRAPHLLILPAIAQNERAAEGGPAPGKRLPPERLGPLSDALRSRVTTDLNRWQPHYVLVDVCSGETGCLALPPGFQILPWFERSPAFVAAWSNYRYDRRIQDVPSKSAWDLYVPIHPAVR